MALIKDGRNITFKTEDHETDMAGTSLCYCLEKEVAKHVPRIN